MSPSQVTRCSPSVVVLGVGAGFRAAQLLDDPKAVDVSGAVEMKEERGVAQQPLHTCLSHHTKTAVNLHPLPGHLEGGFGRQHLCHEGEVAPVWCSAVVGAGGVVHQRSRRLHPDRHVGQTCGYSLVPEDRPAPLYPVTGETGLGHAHGLGGDDDLAAGKDPARRPGGGVADEEMEALLALERGLTTTDGLVLTEGSYIIEARRPGQ